MESLLSIIVDENTRLIVQGITGSEGTFHTRACIEYGTNVVAGCTPGKGGTLWDNMVPVYNTVADAVKASQADASLIFVPAPAAADAILEAAAAGLSPIICVTEGIPTADMLLVRHYMQEKSLRLIGPNCPGIISPGKCKAGLMASEAFRQGKVGLCSRSGTLTYEIAAMLTQDGIGQSTCVGIGGDPITGSTFVEILELFQEDPDTEVVVLIGEIGGSLEQEAAVFIKERMTKPVVAFIAGLSAPTGRRMGHAGAIITGTTGGGQKKVKTLKAAGVNMVNNPTEIPSKVREVLGQ